MSPFELGLSLLGGRASKAWNARAIRARALLAGAVGGAPPGCEADPPSPPEDRPALHMKATATARGPAVDAAKEVVDALGRRRFDRLTDLLADAVWVLWPNGSLLRHPKAALAGELGRREGERLPLKAADPRVYSFAELRSALARGIAEAFDAVLGIADATLVTLLVSGGRGPPGRVLLVMETDGATWKARSLPLGGPDDAHALSVKLRDLDRPEAAALQPLVRAFVLGHGGLVRASFQHLMPRLWLREQLFDAEQLARLADEGPPRLTTTELVFGRAREVELKKLNQLAPKPGLAQLQARAFEDFGRTFDELSPRLLSVELGVLDPTSGRPQAAPPAHGLLVRTEDDAGRVRPRVAGLYV